MVEITGRRIVVGAGGILTILWLFTIIPSGPVYGVKIDQEPFFASCGLTDCFDMRNISHNYTDEICFSRSRVKLELPSIAKFESARYWGNKTEIVNTYGWVEHSYTCQYDFNYTQNPNYAWCYYTTPENGTTKTVIVFKHNWTRGNIPTKTIWWNEWGANGSVGMTVKGWKEIPLEICLQPNRNYTIKTDFRVPLGSYDKYNVSIRLPDSWGGNIFLLDPWWDVSYDYRRQIHNMSLVPQPINASNYDNVSDIDANDINETIYAMNCSFDNLTIYYNCDTDIKGIANGTNSECFWFQTSPTNGSGGSRPDELIRYFPLDNNFTNGATDYANGSNGTIHETTRNVTGKIYKAHDFDGTDDYVDISGVEEYVTTLGKNWSVSLWVKFDVLSTRKNVFMATTAVDDKIFIAYGSGEAGCGGDFTVQSYDGATVRSTGKDVFTDTINWNHAVATQGADRGLKFYLNGVLQGGSCYAGGGGAKGARLGTDTDGFFDFDGLIDETLIFNKTLSPAEVTALYELGAYLGSEESIGFSISWGDWTGKNTTTFYNYTTVTWTTSKVTTNCTLYANISGVLRFFHNTSSGTSYSKNLTNIGEGNYTMNVTCKASDDAKRSSSNAWWDVSNYTGSIFWDDWTGLNSTTVTASLTPTWRTDIVTNCTLYFNGTVYPIIIPETNQSTPDDVRCSGSWDSSNPCSNTYDNDYGTYGIPNGFPKRVFVLFNYTIPDGVNNVTWNFKNATLKTQNVTLPSACFQDSVVRINTSLYWAYLPLPTINVTCWNGSHWDSILNRSCNNCFKFYEESILWNISSTLNFSQTIYGLITGNYSTINVTCGDDPYKIQSTNAWAYTISPLSFTWADKNTTFTGNETDITVESTVLLDWCLLNFNGTEYFMPTGVILVNYSADSYGCTVPPWAYGSGYDHYDEWNSTYPCSNASNGDWDSDARPVAYYQEWALVGWTGNYTIPYGVSKTSSFLELRHGGFSDTDTYNYTIPQECLDDGDDTLKVAVLIAAYGTSDPVDPASVITHTWLACKDDDAANWITGGVLGLLVYGGLYETQMWWQYPSNNTFQYNLTYPFNGNFTSIYVNCSYQGERIFNTSIVWLNVSRYNDEHDIDVSVTQNITQIVFDITSYTMDNVTPENQSVTQGIFNITANGTAGFGKVWVRLNDTADDCLIIYIDNSSSLMTTTREEITTNWVGVPFQIWSGQSWYLWLSIYLNYCPSYGNLDFYLDFKGA